MKAHVLRFDKVGGPDVLFDTEIDLNPPGPGEVAIRQEAIGLNYMDVYHRTGAVPVPVPNGLGVEAAGVVEAVGPDVNGFKPGDRVAYAGGSPGAYADRRNYPAARVVKIPDGVSAETAAAVLMKGITVEMLLDRCAPLKAGQFGLMYAAAGGVGLVAGQWARARGIKLIGVTSGADKKALALANGYHAVIDRNAEDVAARAREIAGGGLPAVYDSIGKATFEASIKSLAPRGVFVSFGTTSGPPPPVDAGLLMRSGSLYFTRPTIMTYAASREDLEKSACAVFDLVAAGALNPVIGQRYPLKEAARAHADLEAGRTSGASILTL